jgi:hypothetical protein
VQAVHLGGVRSLPAGRADLELRFSDAGLHIYDLESRTLVGQLDWAEITAVELERRKLGRVRRAQRLIVATASGRAVFALPGLTRSQLAEHLGPMLTKPSR